MAIKAPLNYIKEVMMSESTKDPASPFLDISSFTAEGTEVLTKQDDSLSTHEIASPFRSIYELEGQKDFIDPEAEEFISFLTEFHDTEFDEAVFELVNEAADLYESRFEGEYGGSASQKIEAERFLEQHFAPLTGEVEALLEAIADDIQGQNLETMSESEIDTFIDKFVPNQELSPSFENLWGWVKKKAKKAAKWAKKKAKALAKKAFNIALKKLKKYMKPWLNKIVKFAINKLPKQYREPAKLLAQRLGLQKEIEYREMFEINENTTGEVTQFQQEFDLVFANLLFAEDETQQELILAEVISDSQQLLADPLGDLDRARNQFIGGLNELEEGEDPTPLIENFIPAVLPFVKLGLKFYGRRKLVNFLAKYIAKLIKRLIPPNYVTPLSRAIVDAGLRMINLEATPEDEQRVALEAITDTVEETVRQVATLPEYILNNEELLEGYVLEAFESAAASTLPQILSDKDYQKRPELRETIDVNGTWVRQPLRGKKYYKKFTRVFDVNITPHMAREVKTWRGIPLAMMMQEQYNMPHGQTIKARVHLYEAIPGTWLSRVSKYEKNTTGLGTHAKPAWSKIHPLTPKASAIILGQPRLGRAVAVKYLADPLMISIGQRFYYLEVPDSPAQRLPVPGAPIIGQRCCQTHLMLDFPRDQIRVSLFLSEAEAQRIAMKLRQQIPVGPALRSVFEPGLKNAFSEGMYHQVKIVHKIMAIEPSPAIALKWLPSIVQETLEKKLTEWVGYSLNQHLKQRAQDLIAAAEDLATGLTIVVRLNNPPGFANIRRILANEPVSLSGMKFPEGMPEAQVQIMPGYLYE